MPNSRVNRNDKNSSFLFSTTKVSNISCAFCRHQFYLRELLHLRAPFFPLLLSCGHAACHKCVQIYANDSCPLCNIVSKYEISQSKCVLPVNIYVTGLLAIMTANAPGVQDPDISFSQSLSTKIKEYSTESSFCSQCHMQAAIKSLQCDDLFCHTCVEKVHAKMETSQQHFRVLLTNSSNDCIFDTKRCSIHNQIFGWYCNDCEHSVCYKCSQWFHSAHQCVSLTDKNNEYMDDFMKASKKLAETLQQIRQTQKKIWKTLVSPEELQSSVKMVETAINQHFAHLHGVLQNVERRMIDKLYEQRNDRKVNLIDIQRRLKTHEDRLQSTLQMAATVNAIIDKINLKDVIAELERLADVPCHLVQDPIVDEKIVFCPDPSIIEILENHCRIEIPKLSGYNLLPNNAVSTEYKTDSFSRQEVANGRNKSFCSNTTLMKRASSSQSLFRGSTFERRLIDQAAVAINQSSRKNHQAKVHNPRKTKTKECISNFYASRKSSTSDLPTTDPYKLPIKIVRVVSPDKIYVCDTSLEKEYEQMMIEMQKFYNKYKDVSNKCDWQINHPCVVYSTRDRCFCRGEITAFNSSDEVQVFLYDLALTETVPISELQALKKKFWITPTYVCKVKLAGILPCGDSSVWPSTSCEKLKGHISKNQHTKFYISKVVTPGEDELNVDLWVKEVKIDGPLSPARIEFNSINQMLVDFGLALPIKQYNDKKTKVLAIELKRQISCIDESLKNNTSDWTANGDFKERQSIIATAEKSLENDESFISSAANSMSDDQSEKATSFLESSTSTEDSFVSSAQALPSTDRKLVAWLPAEPIPDDNFVAVPTNLDHNCHLHLHSKSQNEHVLRFIATTLHAEYSTSKVGPWDLEWEEGELCIAQWYGNKKWYRAQVVRIFDNMIEVEFIDYGNIEECENGTLRKRLTLTHIPRQSTKCVISGLLPNTSNGRWSTGHLDRIHNLLVEKECEVSVLKRNSDHLVVSIDLLTPMRSELVSYLINEVRMNVQPDVVDPRYSNDETESTIENIRDVIVVGYVKNPVSETQNSEHEDNTSSEKEKNIENNVHEYKRIANNDMREITNDKSKWSETNCNEKNEKGKADNSSVIADLPNPVSALQSKEALPYIDDCALSIDDIINLNHKNDDVAISGTANFTLGAEQIEICQREAMSKLESESFLDWNSLNEREIITSTPLDDSLALAPKGYKTLVLPKDVKLVKAEVVLVGLTKAWLHLLDNGTSKIISKLRDLYEKIMQNMQDCANEQPLLNNFEKNTPCCAKFVDGKWYRCKIVKCSSDSHELGEMVQVRFVDWGNIDSIRRDEIRTLKNEWFDASCMAFRCRLWRIVGSTTADCKGILQMKLRQVWRVGETPPRPVHVKIEGHSGTFYDVQIYTDKECTELIYQSLVDDGLFLNKSIKAD